MTENLIPIGWTLISDRHLNALAEGLAEIMATDRGESDQPISDILDGILTEVLAAPNCVQGFANWRSHDGTSDPEADGHALVEVCFRDGTKAFGIVYDWDENWQWADSKAGLESPGAIIAWRYHMPTTNTSLIAEVKRLRPHYQSQSAMDQARRQLLDHFEKFATKGTKDADNH